MTNLSPFVLIDDLSLLCTGETCTGYEFNGPNGIEVMTSSTAGTTLDDIMLIAVNPNRLIRAVMNTSSATDWTFTEVVIDGAESMDGLDGIVADPDPDSSLLYITGGADGAAYTLNSPDNWISAALVTTLLMRCPNMGVDGCTTIAVVEGLEVAGICNNYFGPGPYEIVAFPLKTSAYVPDSTYVLNDDGFGWGLWSIEYHKGKDRMVVASNNGNGVKGVPVVSNGNEVEGKVYDALTHTYFTPTSGGNCEQILFLAREDDCNLWLTCTSYILVDGLPAYKEGPQGAGMINMCANTNPEDALSVFIDFEDILSEGTSVLVKHVVYPQADRTDIFVTDLWTGNVIKAGDVHSASPTVSILIPGGGEFVFSNGLEIFGSQLLIGSNFLWSFDLTDDDASPVKIAGTEDGSPVSQSEGIRFNGDKSLLYFPRYLTLATDPNEIIVLTSDDGWTTSADVVFRFRTPCVSTESNDMYVNAIFHLMQDTL